MKKIASLNYSRQIFRNRNKWNIRFPIPKALAIEFFELLDSECETGLRINYFDFANRIVDTLTQIN